MWKNLKILLLIIILFEKFIYAETIRVPHDVATIQQGIVQASPGDTVLVAPGIYEENINFMGKNIVVASHYIMDGDPKYVKNTIIDGSKPLRPDTASCVLIVSGEDSNAVLQGFTLTGGAGTIRAEPNDTYWREGGGIMIINSSPTIKNNLIIRNNVLDKKNVTGTGGGGISCFNANPKILNNVITLNQAPYAAGIMLCRSGVILKNNLICQNTGGQDFGGGGIVMERNGPAPKIMENNTIVANSSFGHGFYGGRAGGLLVFKTSVTARNNIIWGNVQNNGGQIYFHHEFTSVDFTYNDIEGDWDGVGNIDSLPGFSGAYYYLSESSPCIDSGDPNPTYNDPLDPVDQTNANHPAKGRLRNDMGAYGGPMSLAMTIPDVKIPYTPYSGFSFNIPGRIDAENFNWGAEGSAYHDTDHINQGKTYRFSGVDIERCEDFGGGYNISHIMRGEWLTYTVDVKSSEIYDLTVRVASETDKGRFHIEFDHKDVSGSIQVPNTGGQQKWQQIAVPAIKLPAGEHVIRFVCENGGFNVNAFQFSFALSTLPTPWQSQDIGDVSMAGRGAFVDGVFYIEGSGTTESRYSNSDGFHFVYQKVSGNTEIIARVRTQTHTQGRAGLMIRETLDSNSKNIFVGVSAEGNWFSHHHRKGTGERTDWYNTTERRDSGWLKLTRIGNTFTGYISNDGRTWIEVGAWFRQKKFDIHMTDPVYVGLAIISNNVDIISHATFDNVEVRQLP